MKLFHIFKDNVSCKNLQGKNYLLFKILLKQGYPLPRIRKALVVLNGIKLREFKIAPQNLSRTISGFQRHAQAVKEISEALGIPPEDLFPEAR